MSVLIMQAALLARSGKRPIDPDAQSIIDRIIPEPDAGWKERINNFIVALKNPSYWSAAGALWYGTDSLEVFNGAEHAQGALLDWAYNSSATLHGNTAFVEGVGVAAPVGQALTANYLRTHYTPKTRTHWSDNDSSATVITSRENTASAAPYLFGCVNSIAPNQGLIVGHTGGASGQTRGYIAYGSYAYNSSADSRQAGRIVSISKSGENQVVMIDGVSGAAVSGAGSTAAYLGDIALGGSRPSGAAGVDSPSDLGYGLFHAGRAITATEQATLKALYDAYVSAA